MTENEISIIDVMTQINLTVATSEETIEEICNLARNETKMSKEEALKEIEKGLKLYSVRMIEEIEKRL